MNSTYSNPDRAGIQLVAVSSFTRPHHLACIAATFTATARSCASVPPVHGSASRGIYYRRESLGPHHLGSLRDSVHVRENVRLSCAVQGSMDWRSVLQPNAYPRKQPGQNERCNFTRDVPYRKSAPRNYTTCAAHRLGGHGASWSACCEP